MSETFHARFPVSISAAHGLSFRLNICRPAVDTEAVPLHARKTSDRQGEAGCLLSRAFSTPPEVRGDEKKTRVPGNKIGVLRVT